jgi:hypothetical protein
MSKVKFEPDNGGIRALLKSSEAMALAQEYADMIRNRCGAGYETSQYVGRLRARVSVFPATREARLDNYENNTLLKARGGGQ